MVSVTGETQNESLLLDPGQSVGLTKKQVAEALLTPLQLSRIDLAAHCLCAASDVPLDDDRPLAEARVPITVPLRLVPRPVSVTVYPPAAAAPAEGGDGAPASPRARALEVQLQAATSALLTRLVGELALLPADWRAYELVLERANDVVSATASPSTRSSESSDATASPKPGTPDAGGTLRRKRRRRNKRLVPQKTLREQGVRAGAVLRVLRVAAGEAAPGDEKKSPDDDDHIYPEPAQGQADAALLMASNTLRAGSLCALIRKLTSPSDYDREFMETFLVTYRSFVSPRQLLHRIVERFDVPADYTPELAQTIRVRVMVFVKNWISRSASDLVDILTELQTFVSTKLASMGGDGLLRALDKSMDELKAAQAETAAAETQRQMSKHTREAADVSLIDCDPHVVAAELTAEAHRRFQAIRTTEFFNECW